MTIVVNETTGLTMICSLPLLRSKFTFIDSIFPPTEVVVDEMVLEQFDVRDFQVSTS